MLYCLPDNSQVINEIIAAINCYAKFVISQKINGQDILNIRYYKSLEFMSPLHSTVH